MDEQTANAVKLHLKKALDAIDDAESDLRSSDLIKDADVQMALSELDDAEAEIKRAILELG